jgi:hypothetical protein
LLACYVTVAGALACSADFPNQPDSALTLQPVAWPSELHVTDVDTIEIQARLRDSPQTVTGLRVQWRSSNDGVLRVAQLQPAEGASLEDTLVAQRRAVVTARSGGSDTVRVVVEAGAGFEAAESTYVIRVAQKWVAVSAGAAHTCGITVDSLAYCWGEGNAGRLGTGRPIPSPRPELVLGLGDLKFIAVSAGNESSCGIIREHVAYCWGSNAEGRLGNGDPSERSQFLPTPVTGPSFSSLDVGRVVCGVGEDLLAFCWGSNVDGQLGHFGGQPPPLDPCLNNNPKGCSLAPRQVSPNDTTPATYRHVSVGGHHVCGLSQAPDSLLAFCWGAGPFGALGNAAVTSSATPAPVAGGLRFVVIAAGGDHSCAIATSGATYCWGANANGQLGNGAAGDVGTPDAVTPGDFDSLTAGGQHTCALTSLGEASCWGLGSSGQLGNGSTIVQRSPTAVSDGRRFTALSAGESHTCGVTSDGSLYCWGQGTEGQLGTGDLANHTTPTRVAEP